MTPTRPPGRFRFRGARGWRLDIARRVLLGAAAGAAGTTALNLVSYADMAWRARPASEVPAQTVEKLADLAGAEVPGEGDDRAQRLTALGALSGLGVGVAVGAAYGLLLAPLLRTRPNLAAVAVSGLAMAASDVPAARLDVVDPTSWSTADWVSDLVPHLVYGIVTVRTLGLVDSS